VGVLNLNKLESQLPDLPLINTNIFSQLLLTELLLKQTEQNMINLGSIMGTHPMPFLSQYAATKAFARVFSDSVVKESKITNGKIRMMNLMPFYVETKMTNYTKFIFSVQTEQFVK
jgi:short-subunit dehydrogenase